MNGATDFPAAHAVTGHTLRKATVLASVTLGLIALLFALGEAGADMPGAALAATILPIDREDVLRRNDLNAATLVAKPDGRAQMAQDAARQLAVQPLSARALRQSAMLRSLDGAAADGERLHLIAQRVSRRDIGTQLFLIERAAAAGDTGAALTHYDIALTTDRDAATILLPVLIAAMTDEEINAGLRNFARQGRPWIGRLISEALLSGGDPRAIAALVAAAPSDIADNRIAPVLAALIKANEHDAARHLLRAHGFGADLLSDASIREATLDPRLGPFGWSLARTDMVTALAGGRAVTVRAAPNARGVAAQRLLLLAPGRYRLEFESSIDDGNIAPDDLRWTAYCATPSAAATLLDWTINPGKDNARHARNVEIPDDCGAIRLILHMTGPDSQQDGEVRIASISLVPAGQNKGAKP